MLRLPGVVGDTLYLAAGARSCEKMEALLQSNWNKGLFRYFDDEGPIRPLRYGPGGSFRPLRIIKMPKEPNKVYFLDERVVLCWFLLLPIDHHLQT